ncbi:hypothetical protein [Hyunsoonleella rubra]|uniref:T9SS type A sorting domain-containing protein n=1 Tax=Hyunsoonleella rubra TaxID=1737062 RepID=A0ABW5TDB7_9FLAO
MKKITYLLMLLLVCSWSYGQILTFDFAGNVGDEASVISNSNDAGLTSSAITRGSGLSANNNANSFNSQDWALTNIANAVTGDNYVEFTVTPNSGYEFDITSINIDFYRSATGVRGLALRSSIDSYTSNIDTEKVVLDNTNLQSFSFTVSQLNNTSAVTYRIYGWSEATGGSGRFESGGNDIEVNGTVGIFSSCTGVTTWDGTSWDNGVPALATDVAVIDGAYTTNATDGSFSACSLIVTSTGSLTIENSYYVEVVNNVDVNAGGTILVQPEGAFIQNNDSGTVTNNGTIQVAKDTAPLNNWYEYTYWSSPVSNATVNLALSDSDSDRRYTFNASQFNDALAETGNNNVFVAGQDDIDDEGDDWQWVNGISTMTPGVGYAATHSEIAYVFPGVPYRYTFEGTFNNGIVNVPVDRNDATTSDFNWNFIGNPYPSAIEVAAFMTQNMYDGTTNPSGTLDGAIYFWSHNTDLDAATNGEEAFNFTTSDYAIKNGASSTAGGDGLAPNDFIPSGQGFFVNFSDSRPTNSGTVVFNNAMRSLSLFPDNSQFFKGNNSKKDSQNDANKLWLDLTSDNGVFNQISIAYVNGATNGDDGAFYDAHKIVAPTTYAALYSKIENSNLKYAIQGRNFNSINVDEVIQLGFSTIIDVPTIYTLSIANLQGDYLTNNTVYLKDNLENKLHNLSDSDYTFTSEVGEFNERFEIVFDASALSIEDNSSESNELSIVELEGDKVQFSTSGSTIKSVAIFDLLGRQLYDLKGTSASETYALSNLKSSIFIAKIELSNGTVITKKAIKQ